jgi:hypothetical protein
LAKIFSALDYIAYLFSLIFASWARREASARESDGSGRAAFSRRETRGWSGQRDPKRSEGLAKKIMQIIKNQLFICLFL